MAPSFSLSWFLLMTTLTYLSLISCFGDSVGDKKVYVVYMGEIPKGDFSVKALHMNMLREVLGSKKASESWIRSYKRSFNGFVARLSKEEKEKIASMKGVVSVFESTKKKLHTTRSWDFMGFPKEVKRTKYESDIIIGMLDTGIWPESESFNDEGFGPPPSKWKGTCQSSSNFTCNNKVIGAKFYYTGDTITDEDLPSPRDSIGHGSHTASTAAGDLVSGASLLGLASGTARGGVPAARLAVYKICWSDGCSDADILAAFDDAIADGVDIISISVGGDSASEYFDDPIAIGAFHAMKHGILTSNSGGNSGSLPYTIVNVSPWSLSVAASTIDRKFLTAVKLGNGKTYEGVSINTFKLGSKMYPLVYGGGMPNTKEGFDSSSARYYQEDTLDGDLVNGTIVFFDELMYGETDALAGAKGTIMRGSYLDDFALSFQLAASYLGSDDGAEVFHYMNTTSEPKATIHRSMEAKDISAPVVVSFSSRGPNPVTNDILKPDLTAPGVDILAAWSEATTVTGLEGDTRIVPYNIVSGTSMSCPHATAAAAYVKSFNPSWSPAAIKSALMTTAAPMSVATNTDAEFAYGSGHIDPVKARSPGLIYDMGETDYVNFLCGQNYDSKMLQLITGDNSTCTKANNATVWDLNYPSFTLSGTSDEGTTTRVFHRTVTNVGSPVSTYKAVVKVPGKLRLKVDPAVLHFKSLGEKKSFTVTIVAKMDEKMFSGSLVWDDGVYLVRSPIVAYAA